MAEVGTYYITIMPEMSKFTRAVSSAMNGSGAEAGTSFSNSFLDVLKGSAIGTFVGNLATELGNQIAAGLQTGIKRLDTLENFPRVMQALGFEASEASASIQLIMQKLDGLPTATQDVVTLTQAIADSTSDLDLATRAALGFNDMLLANGASSAEMTQAMGVFNRVLGKGNATVAQWQSLQSVMPAQLNMVAKSMLGEAGTVEELRDKLNEGEVSWEDFLRAIVKLDEEGTGRYESFRNQAVANSVGIGTALQNVQNRIGAGWADILGSIGQKEISGAIDSFSYGLRDAMYVVGDAVEWLKWMILGSSIDESLVRIGATVKEFFAELIPDDAKVQIKDFARSLIDLAEGGLAWIADHGEVVKAVLAGIAGAIAVVIGYNIANRVLGLVATVQTLFGVLAANPMLLIVAAIAAVVTALYEFFTNTEQGRQMWEKFTETMGMALEKAKTVCKGLVTAIKNFVTNTKAKWNEVTTTTKLAWDKIKTTVTIVMNALKKAFTDKINEMKQSAQNVFNAIKTVISTIISNISSSVSNTFTVIKTTITTAINAAKTAVENALNAIKAIWNSIFGGIESKTSSTTSNIQNLFTVLASTLSTIVGGIGTTLSGAWNGISSAASSILGGMSTKVSSLFSSMSSSASSSASSMNSSVTSSFKAMKDNAVSQMDSLNSQAASKASKIASHFNGLRPTVYVGVSYPALAAIYSKVSKSSLLDGGKVSTLYWAAQGAVFDMPTIIGIGEAGKEAALPLNDKTYREMAHGIVSEMGGGGEPAVIISGNTFYLQSESDIDNFADRVALRIQRQRAGAL